MHISEAVTEGVLATALMTLWIYTMAAIFDPRLKVIKVLGTMLTRETTSSKGLSGSMRSIMTGTGVHYLAGILASLVYHFLWMHHIGAPKVTDGLLFGIAHGLLAVIVWKVFLSLHSNPPLLPNPHFFSVVFIGHLLYQSGVTGVHHFFHSDMVN